MSVNQIKKFTLDQKLSTFFKCFVNNISREMKTKKIYYFQTIEIEKTQISNSICSKLGI